MVGREYRDTIARHLEAVRNLFAEQLAVKFRRTVDEIRDEGLGAGDFKTSEEVAIAFGDGSSMSFRYAFVVTDATRRIVGVFTEHCGYHAFGMVDLAVTELRADGTSVHHEW